MVAPKKSPKVTKSGTKRPATVAAYVDALPEERRTIIERLRKTFKRNLPKGFEETLNYGMIGYVVPLELYPAGYHVSPSQPLPFISLASQKQYVAVYHMGLYSAELSKWFGAEWQRHTDARLDCGKSCIRLRDLEGIPYELFGELARKMTPRDWIAAYEQSLKRAR
jgi:hypothetical protein